MLIATTETIQEALDVPLRILIIVVIATALAFLLRFVVARVVRRLAKVPARAIDIRDAKITLGAPNRRMGQRLRTFQSVLNSTIAIVVAVIALLMILSEVGVNVGPLIASAGVAGVALAFGAQSLVRDIVSGVFMLVEDQYGVGDRVELAAGATLASGVVEEVALRITTLRDDEGTIWYVRNGEILRVSNESQGWSQATVVVQLAPGTDPQLAREAMVTVTDELGADPGYRDSILAEPVVLVSDLSAAGVEFTWTVRTASGQQWLIASGMRRGIAKELDRRGIELAG